MRALLRGHRTALEAYYDPDSGGFYHVREPGVEPTAGDFSKASTATVVNFLARSGYWYGDPWSSGDTEVKWKGRETDLARAILEDKEWNSAQLGAGNAFTTGFLLEALHSLRLCGATIDAEGRKRIDHEAARMNVSLEEGSGGISLQAHPPKAYLTQLVVRALLKWNKLESNAASFAQAWAVRNLDRELVIMQASPSEADLYEIAYSVVLLRALEESVGVQGDIVIERYITRYAIEAFFRAQLDDGTWPRSRPLFHYPNVGNAYCFEYELLVQMLIQPRMWPLLLPKIPQLKKAIAALENRKYPVARNAFAWSSGHHRQLKTPESWSTASVFHSCYELDRLTAEAIRREVFVEVGEEYQSPSRGDIDPETVSLPAKLLDATFRHEGTDYSLREVIEKRFLQPIAREVPGVGGGRSFSKKTPISAILYGPPGTSKTQLARYVADAVGWPLLKVDPSYLVRNGLENVQSEANRLFDMLVETEEVVVLFDEIDELVRERGAPGEVLSRFLTTAMLPKWAALSDRRQIIYLVATNHLEVFDIAISRPGRFDVIVPVNPPTAQEKLREWPKVNEKLTALGLQTEASVLEAIATLTYAEFDSASEDLSNADTVEEFKARLERAVAGSVAKQPAAPELVTQGSGTWESVIADQGQRIRLPRLA